MRTLIYFLALTTIYFTYPSFAASNVEKWEFKSKHSHFYITVKKGQLFYQGKKVDGSKFSDFEKMFDPSQAFETCTITPKNPDVTITAHTLADQKVSRFFYFKENLVGFADKCLSIQGQGVYRVPSLPLWFFPLKMPKIDLEKEFSLQLGDKTVSYKHNGKQWDSTTEGFYTHWSYFSALIESLSNPEPKEIYSSQVKAPLSGAKSFSIVANKNTYQFLEIYPGVWGLEDLKQNIIVTSSNWGGFSQLNLSQLTASYANDLNLIMKDPKNSEQLREVVKNISPTWNQDIKKVYLSLISKEELSDESRYNLYRELKKHPSEDVLTGLSVLFLVSTDLQLLSDASRILRIQYPTAPLINNKDSLDSQRKNLIIWEKIALKNKTSTD